MALSRYHVNVFIIWMKYFVEGILNTFYLEKPQIHEALKNTTARQFVFFKFTFVIKFHKKKKEN